mmetsp:Transcript_599/g.1424  ORF Transcript_599/g.1424 Transcript_599/m.1424 type:complete len:295 (+) Transcript_599:2074-2958(+)
MTNNEHNHAMGVRPTEDTMTGIFQSTDSMGSFKHDFMELFRSVGSNPGDFSFTSATEPRVADGKYEVRSRSSSLETQEYNGPDVTIMSTSLNLSLHLPVCPHAAASLANAGHLAEKLEAEESELVGAVTPQNGPDDVSTTSSLSDDPLRLPSPMEQQVVEEKPKKRKRKIYEPEKRLYVEYTGSDVLCQRGGLANTHEGNQRFRNAKDDLQEEYFNTPKLKRTEVSQKLVDTVHTWGGRFLKKDGNGWYEAHNHVARTKAGQALRETYTPEDRAAKRAKYAKKKTKQKRKSKNQ